jgi:hypothetical protein
VIASIDRELELPRRQQSRRHDEADDQEHERRPAPSMKTAGVNRGRAQERSNQCVSGELCAGPLPNPRDERDS